MLFALVDCNNFYASCERAFNPSLEKKPIIVLSNNDGCVIARSNEAKKLGIPMGAPFFKWQSMCHKNKVNVFSSNYELYGDMSHRVMELLAQYADEREVYSIDEAFLMLPPETDKDYLIKVRDVIKRSTGLPVSIGVGETKTLAKMANYIAKNHTEDNVYFLNHADAALLKNFPIEKIWGIGSSLTTKLKSLNLHNAYDLQHAEPKYIRQHFSVTVEKIVYELRGVSCLSLELPVARKQIISSRSFGKAVTKLSDLEEAISHYAAVACAKLRGQDSLASAVGVFLQSNRFNNNEKKYENSTYFPFVLPTDNTPEIIRIAKQCITLIYKKDIRYHKTGLILMDLIPNSTHQLDLLNQANRKNASLTTVVDSINSMYGRDAVFYAAEGIKRVWQIKRNYCSPCYTTRWNEILKVK